MADALTWAASMGYALVSAFGNAYKRAHGQPPKRQAVAARLGADKGQ
jgi:hypothetical protein